jgi:hypothetical protein
MNRIKGATRSDSEQVTTDEIVERQQDLIRELHELLTTYGPTWYTEEIDSRLSETLAMCTSVTQARATLVTMEQRRNSNRSINHTLCGDRFEACVRDTLGCAGWSPLSSLAKTATVLPAYQLSLGGPVINVSKSSKMRMKELRTKRKPLWKRFESNPNEIQLAAELRIIDDLIAECNEKRNQRDDEIDVQQVAAPEVGCFLIVQGVSQASEV